MQFTIDSENNIRPNDTVAEGEQAFKSAAALATLPLDLVAVWNSFAGAPKFQNLKPVKKFTSRSVGAERIWNALQRLVEPEKTETIEMPKTKTQSKRKAAPAAKKAKAAAAVATAGAPREGSQKALLIELLGRKGGATLPELMKATGWQAHSIRGAISTLGSKGGMKIESSKNQAGERVYQRG